MSTDAARRGREGLTHREDEERQDALDGARLVVRAHLPLCVSGVSGREGMCRRGGGGGSEEAKGSISRFAPLTFRQLAERRQAPYQLRQRRVRKGGAQARGICGGGGWGFGV